MGLPSAGLVGSDAKASLRRLSHSGGAESADAHEHLSTRAKWTGWRRASVRRRSLDASRAATSGASSPTLTAAPTAALVYPACAGRPGGDDDDVRRLPGLAATEHTAPERRAG